MSAEAFPPLPWGRDGALVSWRAMLPVSDARYLGGNHG